MVDYLRANWCNRLGATGSRNQLQLCQWLRGDGCQVYFLKLKVRYVLITGEQV